MGAKLPLGTCRKYEISIEIARLKGARGEGAKVLAVGKYVCGARLKELFEKSSLRIFKNFPADVIFYLIENFRSAEIYLQTSPKANLNSRIARS